MSTNRKQWQRLLDELAHRQAQAEAMGGEARVARHHDSGRLTARERISLLFDADTFNEIGALAGGNHPAGDPPLAGDGVVGGIGKIQGRSVVVMAEDFTVKGGSIGHPNAAKSRPGQRRTGGEIEGSPVRPLGAGRRNGLRQDR